ncbi:hypothetical protein DM860_011086 [Cuscuta australis]|uniref:U-box domain-containing protein n=1 Tax=Cuscuta australis TaxID=267555 RepID=A0A328E0Q1_9ASTE|nr:hypothetical protein DM860_011086 [Cuscuta australis]
MDMEFGNIPALFRCPISLDLLRDPVTLCTGQTYDRSSIEKWLASGNSTCPITMQKLHDPSLVPNHTLRHCIQRWLHAAPAAVSTSPDAVLDSSSAPQLLTHSPASLMRNLLSSSLTLDQKVQTLQEILGLSEDLPQKNAALVQMDFLTVILDLVFGVSANSEKIISMGFAEQGLVCALKLIPFSGTEAVNTVADQESKFANFLTLFERGSSLVKKSLCNLMEAAASSPEARKFCSFLGKSGRLLRQLNRTINDEQYDVSTSAIGAVSALSRQERIGDAMVRKGAVDSLIKCVLENSNKAKTSSAAAAAMRAIELLAAGTEGGKRAVLENPDGVNAAVKMVFRVSSDHGGSDAAVRCLAAVCEEGMEARERAVRGGVLTQLLLLIQSQCCVRTKTRARLLLRLLRSM